MLPYGCPRVLFKMDKAGAGQQVCLADLPRNRDPGFAGFTHDMFLEVRPALRALRSVVHPGMRLDLSGHDLSVLDRGLLADLLMAICSSWASCTRSTT